MSRHLRTGAQVVLAGCLFSLAVAVVSGQRIHPLVAVGVVMVVIGWSLWRLEQGGGVDGR